MATTAKPAAAAEVERIIQERLDALDKSQPETVTVEWRGSTRAVPVIAMPVKLLHLNPGTHRIRAQRTLDAAKDRTVEADPYGEAAQRYLADLLKGDPKNPDQIDPEYLALKEDLKEHGQTDPGVVTRAGVLINGNTRCTALRELGTPDIRVGVLPPDAGLDDFARVELSLQLRKEYKRQYSFVNFLLAIEEQSANGKPVTAILKEFRIKQATFDRSRWILDFIRDAMKRSEVTSPDGSTVGLRLVDFENHQGKLEELHRAYVAAKAKSGAEADALRDMRLLALALGGAKTDLRNIEPDFLKKFLGPKLPADTLPAPKVAAPATIPGLGVPAPLPDPDAVQAQALTDKVLKAWALDEAGHSPDGEIPLGKVRDALDLALDAAGRHQSLRKKRLAPAERLGDANDDLVLSLDAIRDARATGDFKVDDLEEAVGQLRGHLHALWQLIEREKVDGDSFAWLKEQADL